MSYTKLFAELVASSIWDQDDKTRLVWITMLALKNREHFVRGTVHYLALAARMSDEDCQRSLAKLAGPDDKSRTPDNDGRRIEPVNGGWVILNGEIYQNRLSQAERREYNAAKQREYRARKKEIKIEGEKSGAAQAINEGLRGQ